MNILTVIADPSQALESGTTEGAWPLLRAICLAPISQMLNRELGLSGWIVQGSELRSQSAGERDAPS